MSDNISNNNNARVEQLVFKDESTYFGQVAGGDNHATSHGYGTLCMKDFRMTGYFLNGKSIGPGVFHGPNGTFYGYWNTNNKRDGDGALVTEDKVIVEKYSDGKLIKRVIQRTPSAKFVHWRSPFAVDIDGENAPSPRYGHSVCVAHGGSMVVVFGGQGYDDANTSRLVPLNDVCVFDVASRIWLRPNVSGDVPPPLYGHTMTQVGDLLYVIGGRRGFEVSSSVYTFDLNTGQWECVIKKGLNFAEHTASLVGSNIYVIVQGSVYVLHVKSLEWEELQVDNSDLFRNRVSSQFVAHSAVVADTSIYVYGGRVVGGHQSDKNFVRCSSNLLIFHTHSRAWEVVHASGPDNTVGADVDAYSGIPTASWKLPRCEHTACLVDYRFMYIIGGFTTCNPTLNVVDTSYVNDVQIFDLQERRWLNPNIRFNYNPPRGQHSSCLVGDDIFVLGGANHAFAALWQPCILHTGAPKPKVRKKKVAQVSPPTESLSETTNVGQTQVGRKQWSRPAHVPPVVGDTPSWLEDD